MSWCLGAARLVSYMLTTAAAGGCRYITLWGAADRFVRERHTHPPRGRYRVLCRGGGFSQARRTDPVMRFIYAVYLPVYHTTFRALSSMFDYLDAYPSEKFIYAIQLRGSLSRTREKFLSLIIPRARGQALSKLIRILRRRGTTITRHFHILRYFVRYFQKGLNIMTIFCRETCFEDYYANFHASVIFSLFRSRLKICIIRYYSYLRHAASTLELSRHIT